MSFCGWGCADSSWNSMGSAYFDAQSNLESFVQQSHELLLYIKFTPEFTSILDGKVYKIVIVGDYEESSGLLLAQYVMSLVESTIALPINSKTVLATTSNPSTFIHSLTKEVIYTALRLDVSILCNNNELFDSSCLHNDDSDSSDSSDISIPRIVDPSACIAAWLRYWLLANEWSCIKIESEDDLYSYTPRLGELCEETDNRSANHHNHHHHQQQQQQQQKELTQHLHGLITIINITVTASASVTASGTDSKDGNADSHNASHSNCMLVCYHFY